MEERCSVLNQEKVDKILSLFKNVGLENEDEEKGNEEMKLSKLMIKEHAETKGGEVSTEEWIGPSNAIEGYVPQRYRQSKSSSKASEKGSKVKKSALKKGKDYFDNVDFMSTIITQDEYSVSKLPSSQVMSGPNQISLEFLDKLDRGASEKHLTEKSYCAVGNGLEISMDFGACNSADQNVSLVEVVHSSQLKGKSSLRTFGMRKAARSVSCADEKPNGHGHGNLCEFREFENTKEGPSTSRSNEVVETDDPQRFASAEACAMALIQAAEAVSSGQSDVDDAVSEAGIMVLPQPKTADETENFVIDDALEDIAPEKYSDNSWFDAAPEGFRLTLSPFAFMWNALFSWLPSSSLAYIYGREESFHEEYMSVNGREYPCKVVLPDGRSPEIKKTLAGCLARALPGLITDLILPTLVSTLEHELACLLDTMSFADALPPFIMKQWQVISLLFIDALSVCRIPGVKAHLTSRRILTPKVLNGAQISAKEFEIMKDLMIPLGRVPQFSMQSGG